MYGNLGHSGTHIQHNNISINSSDNECNKQEYDIMETWVPLLAIWRKTNPIDMPITHDLNHHNTRIAVTENRTHLQNLPDPQSQVRDTDLD